MTRFVHLTDLHLSHPDLADPHLNSDTVATLASVIERIGRIDPAPDFVVLGGDLSNHGAVESYGLLRDMLAGLAVPVVAALGNHDRRDTYRSVFDAGAEQRDAPLFHHAMVAGLHVIVIDSSIPGRVSGGIEPGQFTLLERALGDHADLRKLVVCHHPPFSERTGALPWESLDASDTARLGEMLAGHDIAAMLCGHVHLNRVTIWRGIPVVVNNGLHATVDPLAKSGMVIEEGTGFALCRVDAAGFEATFVPHGPERRVLRRIGEDVLRSFD